jgi:YggT family protein
MVIILGIVDALLQILTWVIIIQVILSWLIAFNVINTHNEGVRRFIRALDRLMAPIYRPIQKLMPDFGGIDFSPLVILLAVWIIRTRVLAPLSFSLANNP